MVTIVVAILAVALWPSAIEIDVAKVERGAMQVTIDEEDPRSRAVCRLGSVWDASADRARAGRPWFAANPLSPGSRPRLRRSSTFAPGGTRRGGRGGPCRCPSTGELQRATAMRTRAQSTVSRLSALESGAISGDELEAAQTTLRSAEEAVRAAEFAVARVEHELQLARARA